MPEPEPRVFEVFVNDTKEVWDTKDAPASDMMTRAGVSPKDFVLEALDRKGGTAVAEFKAGQTVDLSLPERKFFRTTPGGGGFS